MAVDPSIYGQVGRGVEQFNPLAEFAQIEQLKGARQQNQLAQLAFGDRERAIADATSQREAVRGFGTDTTANYNRLLSTGNLGAAQGYLKANADQAKTTADADKTKIETAHKRLEVIGQGLGYLKDNPTLENARSILQNFVQVGLMPPDVAQQKLADFQRDPTPQGIQQLATMGYQGAIAAKDQLPTIQNVTLGNRVQTQAVNPFTQQVTPLASAAIGQSADNIANNATARRGQDIAERAALQGGGVQIDGNGNMVVVPNKVVPGQPTQVSPVVGPDGRPLKGKDGGGPKIGAEVQRQIGGIIAFDKDLDALEKAMKDFDPRNPIDQQDMTKRSRIQSIAKQAQLNAKEAGALGALSGPDLGLLEDIQNDPTSLKGAFAGKGGLAAQLAEARAGNRRRVEAIRDQYGEKSLEGFPVNLRPPSEPAASTPAAPASGAADGWGIRKL